ESSRAPPPALVAAARRRWDGVMGGRAPAHADRRRDHVEARDRGVSAHDRDGGPAPVRRARGQRPARRRRQRAGRRRVPDRSREAAAPSPPVRPPGGGLDPSVESRASAVVRWRRRPMSPERRPDPDELLARVKEEETRQARGKLKIFFGAAAGVGKTYAMLQAAREQRA